MSRNDIEDLRNSAHLELNLGSNISLAFFFLLRALADSSLVTSYPTLHLEYWEQACVPGLLRNVDQSNRTFQARMRKIKAAKMLSGLQGCTRLPPGCGQRLVT